MLEPKQPREFSDFSSYPQNGYGLKDVDREEIYEPPFIPEEEIETQEKESILSETILVRDGGSIHFQNTDDGIS